MHWGFWELFSPKSAIGKVSWKGFEFTLLYLFSNKGKLQCNRSNKYRSLYSSQSAVTVKDLLKSARAPTELWQLPRQERWTAQVLSGKAALVLGPGFLSSLKEAVWIVCSAKAWRGTVDIGRSLHPQRHTGRSGYPLQSFKLKVYTYMNTPTYIRQCVSFRDCDCNSLQFIYYAD